MAIPLKDSLLVPFSANFSARVTASPTTFGFTAPQAAALATLDDGFSAAYAALMNARSGGNRSQSLTTAKDAAKAALLAGLRPMYGAVQVSGTVSDADKDLLGVTVRRMPTPIPVPSAVPQVDVVAVNGRVVRIRIHDAAGEGKRSKPAGVTAAAVSSAVGPTAPGDPSAYKWEGSTTKHIVDVVFPDTVVPGTLVHITAQWLNAKQEAGPACVPVTAQIQFGGTMQQAA